LDPYSKPILVIGQFEYYLAGAETIPTSELDVHIFTFPADPSLFAEDTVLESQLSASAMPSIIPASHSFHGLNASETAKRLKTLDLSASPGVNSEITLIKAVKDLPFKFKRLAVDSEQLASPFLKADMEFSYSNGDQILRDIRLQKTPMEIEIMRFAAQANAESGLAAAKTARAGATLYDIRREFYKECTARGLKPSFMVVDGDVSEHSNTKIAEGRSFLIDCVSSSLGYHGDYGRTVCIGDPTREIKKATDAIANVWESLLPQLKAGLTYGNIQEMAAKIFKEKPSDAALNCNPHSVGIHHTDEPSLGYSDYYSKANLTLMEGMVLSIDLPMVETGLGGSAHLEDLVLITKDGAELLNDAGDRVIIV
jgi:Xaa-Pro aminopeptidase